MGLLGPYILWIIYITTIFLLEYLMCKYFLRKVYLALELLNLANTYWEVLCLCSWWRDCRYNFPWELRKPVWKEDGKDGSYNVTSLFGSSWLFVLMTFFGGRGSLSVRVLYYVLAGILPACLYGDNGKEAFPEIWKHLLVSPKIEFLTEVPAYTLVGFCYLLIYLF